MRTRRRRHTEGRTPLRRTRRERHSGDADERLLKEKRRKRRRRSVAREDDSPSDGDWGLIAPVFGATLTHRRRSKRACFLIFFFVVVLRNPRPLDHTSVGLSSGDFCVKGMNAELRGQQDMSQCVSVS